MKRLLTATSALALATLGLGQAAPPAAADTEFVCDANLKVVHNGAEPTFDLGGASQPVQEGINDPSVMGGRVGAYFGSRNVGSKTPWELDIEVPDDAKAGQKFTLIFQDPFDITALPKELALEDGTVFATIKGEGARLVHITLTENVEKYENIKAHMMLWPGLSHTQYEGLDKPETYNGGINDCNGNVVGKGTVTRDAFVHRNDVTRNSWQGSAEKPSYFTTSVNTKVAPKAGTPFTIELPAHPSLKLTDIVRSNLLTGSDGPPKLPNRWDRMLKDTNYTLVENSDGSITITGTTLKDNTEVEMVFQWAYKGDTVSAADQKGIPYSISYHFGDDEPTVLEGKITPPSSSSSASGEESLAQFGNTVYLDENRNGVQDTGEPGVAGVQIHIKGDGVDKKVTTDKNGKYTSGEIKAGDYTITVTAPDGFEFTTQGEGSVVDAKGNASFTLDKKETNNGINMGIRKILTPKLISAKTLRGRTDTGFYYEVAVKNTGDGDATGVVYSDIMQLDGKDYPAKWEFTDFAKGEVNGHMWNIGTIKPGELVTAKVAVDRSDINGSVTNVFKQTGGSGGGGSATVERGHIQVGKTLITAAEKGKPAIYEIQVANPTQKVVTGAIVRDILDEQQFDTKTLKFGEAPEGTSIEGNAWTIGTVEPGQKFTIQLSVEVKDDALGRKVTNTVKGSTDTMGEPDECQVEGSVDKDTDMCEAVSHTPERPEEPTLPLTGVSALSLAGIALLLGGGGAAMVAARKRKVA